MSFENSTLDHLRKHSIIVADTGDIKAIEKYKPRDVTTNPSLILKAISLPDYKELITETVRKYHDPAKGHLDYAVITPRLMVAMGCEILKSVEGRVSIEVDPLLSFDTEASIKMATQIIELFVEKGVSKDRILIKLASTWEGLKAMEYLEKKGIHCNMTLIFHLEQAKACADLGATLISPFVGRILDWHKNHYQRDFSPQEDPGVLSVKSIYHYLKKYNYPTEVMAASFRNTGEITELAGVDLLTISPALLDELAKLKDPVTPLSPESASNAANQNRPYELNEKIFQRNIHLDAMCCEKLFGGIRAFIKDWDQLKIELQSFL